MYGDRVIHFTRHLGGDLSTYGESVRTNLLKRRETMKRTHAVLLILIASIIISLSLAVTSMAQETAPLVVEESAICQDVVDLQSVGVSDSFDASVGKLFCFTKITGAQSPTQISHAWYFGNTQRAEITLSVKSSSWRTYSSKIIQPHEIGDWHVDILGPGGEILKSLEFKILP